MPPVLEDSKSPVADAQSPAEGIQAASAEAFAGPCRVVWQVWLQDWWCRWDYSEEHSAMIERSWQTNSQVVVLPGEEREVDVERLNQRSRKTGTLHRIRRAVVTHERAC